MTNTTSVEGDRLEQIARTPTEEMMQAGLYHAPDGCEWADVYSIWVDMWDRAVDPTAEPIPARQIAALPCKAEPIPMVLFCPACGVQHIDEPDERTPDWSNPPHRSHLCHGCGHIWRPADVPTTGVQSVQTKGKADSPLALPCKGGGAEKPEPNPEWEAKAKAFRAATVAEAGAVDPAETLNMLDKWTADAEPANEHGQISFSRAMLESAADAIRLLLAAPSTEPDTGRGLREARAALEFYADPNNHGEDGSIHEDGYGDRARKALSALSDTHETPEKQA